MGHGISREENSMSVTTRAGETPSADDDAPQAPRFVVGIGASAGGLESLEKLFRNLPPDTGMAFVVLQHLSPDFKSMMLELLRRDTSMAIHRAEDGMRVEADSVYLLPPKHEMIIRDGCLYLSELNRSNGLHLPIDTFLASLALDRREEAVAIILSGSGSDGARGVREIADHGGFVICETVETAKFGGMPTSALAAGVVDEALAPEAMGGLLQQMASDSPMPRVQRLAFNEASQVSLHGLAAIFDLFQRHYGIDFSLYKESTVHRRIYRRMALLQATSIEAYAKNLAENHDERSSLYADLLINVTQFFRDPETFQWLSENIFSDLICRLEPGQPLRVWSTGCATGEEAYSLAIAIHEVFEQVRRPCELTLFATDIHKPSLVSAGRGHYGRSFVEHLGERLIQKYFVPSDSGFQISPSIRKSIVFAPHNVLSDAPFMDLDFISCRNMLIYFQPAAQGRAISMLYYGLKKDGVLLLGGSESLGEWKQDFEVLHDRARVYRKRTQRRLPAEFCEPTTATAALCEQPTTKRLSGSSQSLALSDSGLYEQLLKQFMPPSLLIDENRVLIDSFGGAERFLRLRAGHPSLDVLDLVDESLRTPISGALGRVQNDHSPVRFSNIKLNLHAQGITVDLTVSPVSHHATPGKHYLISFAPVAVDVHSDQLHGSSEPETLEASAALIRRLREDLGYSRENLQATIEELETSNEELQATNEELIASNEELQGTNEELHSVNEELHTVNAEHQRKITELAELNRDMHLLLENTDVATVFLDQELRIRRYTSCVQRIFDLMEHDLGRPISSFLPKFAAQDLCGHLRQVLISGERYESETLADDGTSYWMRMLPYRVGDHVDGVVLMLVDVSSLHALREQLRWMSAIVASTDDAIIGQDLEGHITSWNFGAEELYGYTASEAIGKHISILIPGDRRDEVEDYRAAIAAGERLHSRDSIRVKKDGSIIHVSLTVSPVFDAKGNLIGISKIARDVSERLEMEAQIRDQVRQREAFIATLSHELRNPLGAALNASRLLLDQRTDTATQQAAAEVIARQIEMTRILLADLLDMSRIAQGKIDLQFKEVDLLQLVDAVSETTLSEAEIHQQEVTWDLPVEPLVVRGDPTRLIQVQVNLIHNALKYSPVETEVKVSLRNENGWAVISIADHGVGIPPGDLTRIFEPFVQVHRTQAQSEGGLGVGLTLVRTLVDAHGGRVEASSDGEHRGSTFRVWLPLAESTASDTGAPTAKVVGVTSTKVGTVKDAPKPMRIVLVEDIVDSREMLASLLSIEGHQVQTFAEGESAVEAIVKQLPDFVLLDIGLPGIDGYEVARQVRSHAACINIPLIALTGYGQPMDIAKAKAAGFTGHLVKPLDIDKLLTMLNQQ